MIFRALIFNLAVAALIAANPQLPRGADVTLARVPNGGIQPQAVSDRTGTIHLIYFLGDASHGDLFYTKSKDEGKTWAAAVRVNSQAGSAIAAGTIPGGQIVLGRGGRIHVAWNGSSQAEPKGPVNPESGKAGEPMLYSRLNDTRTAFEPERNLMTHTFGLDGGGSLAADQAGHVYVAWHGKAAGAATGEAGRGVWITRSDDDGKSFILERSAWNEPTGACGCCGMALYAESKGIVRALYRSATENVHRDIYVLTSHDDGTTFDGRKLHPWNINACPMSSMAFAESAGSIEGAWETGGQVYFENLTDQKAIPISAPGEGKGHKHPRIANGAHGTTLLIWTAGSGWARGGSLAWQLYDSNGTAVGSEGVASGVPTWSFGAVLTKATGFLILY